MNKVYKENQIAAEKLQQGHTITIQGFGNSMRPILSSGQKVIVQPVTKETELHKKDIVLCKVNGHYYLHLISAIKHRKLFQISNNHGHVNGWTNRKHIYGKVIEIL